MTEYSDLVERIGRATAEFARQAAAEACNELVGRIAADGGAAPAAPIKTVLSALRNKGYFALMESVAAAAIRSGQRDPQVRRQHAQGLIDQGKITAAMTLLAELAADTAPAGATPDPADHAEARGLLGRANKQAYVNAVNRPSLIDTAGETPAGRAEYLERARAYREYLQRAIDQYSEVYASDPARYLWHGINTVACVSRAERDGLELERRHDPRRIAEEILERLQAVQPRTTVDVWNRATAIEACVALDRIDAALDWLDVYTNDPKADAFEIGSTLRQLTEVWQLTPGSEPGSRLLPVLHAALLKREGGKVQAVGQELKGLEALLGDTRFLPLQWYRTGLQRCAAVARVETQWGQGFGSGFLVRGEDLNPALAGKVLLLTNAHVISDQPPAFPPSRARVRFEARESDGTAKTYAIGNIVWTSPPQQLDATLLELESALTCDPPYPVAIAAPTPQQDRVYVIGHPMGGGLSLSLQDNRVIDVKTPKLQYRAPTQPGSSGSPVFNQDWELVALHHAGGKEMASLSGSGFVEANEGISISAIIEALKQKFTPT